MITATAMPMIQLAINAYAINTTESAQIIRCLGMVPIFLHALTTMRIGMANMFPKKSEMIVRAIGIREI